MQKYQKYFLICLGIAFIIALTYWGIVSLQKKHIAEKEIFSFGNIVANRQKSEISFSGKIYKTNSTCLFLIYTDSYPWLKDFALIVSEEKLVHLQNAIAFINWEFFDNIRTKKSNIISPKIYILYDKKKIEATDFIQSPKNLSFDNIVFLGDPYFDNFILYHPSHANCYACPMHEIEKDFFLKKYQRLQLNYKDIPKVGTVVKILIKFL